MLPRAEIGWEGLGHSGKRRLTLSPVPAECVLPSPFVAAIKRNVIDNRSHLRSNLTSLVSY